MELSVVLTSAVVGSGVASVVGGLFLLISQCLERRARRQELLLKTATDWAVKHHEHMMQLAKDHSTRVNMPALGWLEHDYYHQLRLLLRRGKLPLAVQREYDAWLQRSDQPGGASMYE